jgi:hypothetical protein
VVATLGAAKAGDANAHNKPAVTKLFQDIRILHLIDKDQIRVAELSLAAKGSGFRVRVSVN